MKNDDWLFDKRNDSNCPSVFSAKVLNQYSLLVISSKNSSSIDVNYPLKIWSVWISVVVVVVKSMLLDVTLTLSSVVMDRLIPVLNVDVIHPCNLLIWWTTRLFVLRDWTGWCNIDSMELVFDDHEPSISRLFLVQEISLFHQWNDLENTRWNLSLVRAIEWITWWTIDIHRLIHHNVINFQLLSKLKENDFSFTCVVVSHEDLL